MSLLNRKEPVTFVLSPTLIKLDSGRITSGSSPLNFVNDSTCAMGRGFLPSTFFANALICSGVAPQHPPIIFTKPESVNSESWAAIWSADSS